MTDVRTEDDSLLPPHSQVRHELMHSQYSKKKEEDSQWQDVSVRELLRVTLHFVDIKKLQ